MPEPQAQRPNNGGATTTTNDRTNLDAAIGNTKILEVKSALERRIPAIEDLLPPAMRGQGQRLVNRAILTLARRPELQSIPRADLVRCVMEAAEVGMSIDGKHGYIVKYKNVYQFQADYKGLVVSLRRQGVLEDCYADVVCEEDRFHCYREDGKSHLRHQVDWEIGKRGQVQAAYAVIVLPGGSWRYELMTRDQLDAIQKRAPSKNGPWATDVDEMRKKTVIRRLLKMYVDDPAAARALAEPWEDDTELEKVIDNTARRPSQKLSPRAEAVARQLVPDYQPEERIGLPETPPQEAPDDTPLSEEEEAANLEAYWNTQIERKKSADEHARLLDELDMARERGDLTAEVYQRLADKAKGQESAAGKKRGK